MKRLLTLFVAMLCLAACDSDKPSPTPDSPEVEPADSPEPAAPQEGAEEDFDALQDKSCKEFYEYSRDVCLQSLRSGLEQSCFKVFLQAKSTRETMAGTLHAKRTENLSEEQKREAFCGRPYKKLAERVAEAETKPRTYPEECKAVVDAIDARCLKPMSEGKESTGSCATALQTVSKWAQGAKFCELTMNVLDG